MTKNAYSQELSGTPICQDGWKVDTSIGSKYRFNDWINSTLAIDLITPKFFGCQAFVNVSAERKVPRFVASYERRDNAYMGMKEKEDKLDAALNLTIHDHMHVGFKV